jgi:hypothetical protein
MAQHTNGTPMACQWYTMTYVHANGAPHQ